MFLTCPICGNDVQKTDFIETDYHTCKCMSLRYCSPGILEFTDSETFLIVKKPGNEFIDHEFYKDKRPLNPNITYNPYGIETVHDGDEIMKMIDRYIKTTIVRRVLNK